MATAAPSTPFRNNLPSTHRFPVGPTADGYQITLLRTQDAGSGFSLAVRNLSKKYTMTFAVQQSNDAGQADAWASMTMRLGATTVTSVLLQPGGYAEVSVDYSASQKPYVALFTTELNCHGYADLTYNNGTFDRIAAPIATPDMGLTGFSVDSGVVPVTATDSVLVLDWPVPFNTMHAAVFGYVGAGGALQHLRLFMVDSVTGTEHPLLADADFNTPTTVCYHAGPSATPNVHQTAANGTFNLLLRDLSAVSRLRFYAGKATTDTTLRLVVPRR